MNKQRKLLWVYFLVGGSYLVFPIYWYIHLWRKIKLPTYQATSDISGRTLNQIKKSYKIVLLIFSLLSVILIITAILVSIFVEINTLVYTFLIVASIILLTIMAIYIIDISENKKIQKEQRILWILLLIFTNLFSTLFYWYLYIWKQPQQLISNL
jgi:hypothetical protein